MVGDYINIANAITTFLLKFWCLTIFFKITSLKPQANKETQVSTLNSPMNIRHRKGEVSTDQFPLINALIS